MREEQPDEEPGPSIEKFRDGWVLVDRDGVIQTPRPMTEERARQYAGLLGIPFKGVVPRSSQVVYLRERR